MDLGGRVSASPPVVVTLPITRRTPVQVLRQRVSTALPDPILDVEQSSFAPNAPRNVHKPSPPRQQKTAPANWVNPDARSAPPQQDTAQMSPSQVQAAPTVPPQQAGPTVPRQQQAVPTAPLQRQTDPTASPQQQMAFLPNAPVAAQPFTFPTFCVSPSTVPAAFQLPPLWVPGAQPRTQQTSTDVMTSSTETTDDETQKTSHLSLSSTVGTAPNNQESAPEAESQPPVKKRIIESNDGARVAIKGGLGRGAGSGSGGARDRGRGQGRARRD